MKVAGCRGQCSGHVFCVLCFSFSLYIRIRCYYRSNRGLSQNGRLPCSEKCEPRQVPPSSQQEHFTFGPHLTTSVAAGRERVGREK